MPPREPRQRPVQRDGRFEEDLERIVGEGADRGILADVLIGVEFAVATNPEAYPIALGEGSVRLLKTRHVHRGVASMPMLGIWFSVGEFGDVTLLRARSIEQVM